MATKKTKNRGGVANLGRVPWFGPPSFMPPERPNIENYMTVGKALEFSSMWDVAGFSSSIRIGARS